MPSSLWITSLERVVPASSCIEAGVYLQGATAGDPERNHQRDQECEYEQGASQPRGLAEKLRIPGHVGS